MSKFKVGDVVVRTKEVENFVVHGGYSRVCTVTWVNYAGDLEFNSDGLYWNEFYFERYVEPENKVPDNMEIVGYQLDSPAGWIDVNKESYKRSCEFGWNTRVLYAFKQD